MATLNRPRRFGQNPEATRKENAARVERLTSWLKKEGSEFTNGRLLARTRNYLRTDLGRFLDLVGAGRVTPAPSSHGMGRGLVSFVLS
jgi:hypothetical protein